MSWWPLPFLLGKNLNHPSKLSTSVTTSEKVISPLQLDVTTSIFVPLLYLLEYSSHKKTFTCLHVYFSANLQALKYKCLHPYCYHDAGHKMDKTYRLSLNLSYKRVPALWELTNCGDTDSCIWNSSLRWATTDVLIAWMHWLLDRLWKVYTTWVLIWEAYLLISKLKPTQK